MEIGRVSGIAVTPVDGTEQAMIILRVDPRYLQSIPSNVVAGSGQHCVRQ